MNTTNTDTPSIFQKMHAWQAGHRAGVAGKSLQHLDNTKFCAVLRDSFMAGYREGKEQYSHKEK